MTRQQPQGPLDSLRQIVPGRDPRLEQPPVGLAVGPEPGRRGLDRALERDRRPVVQRMRERRRRLDPFEAVVGERQAAEEARARAEGMDRGADVVVEPRQREVLGAKAAADDLGRLEHQHAASGPRELDGGREPVRPGADDDGVVALGLHAVPPGGSHGRQEARGRRTSYCSARCRSKGLWRGFLRKPRKWAWQR